MSCFHRNNLKSIYFYYNNWAHFTLIYWNFQLINPVDKGQSHSVRFCNADQCLVIFKAFTSANSRRSITYANVERESSLVWNHEDKTCELSLGHFLRLKSSHAPCQFFGIVTLINVSYELTRLSKRSYSARLFNASRFSFPQHTHSFCFEAYFFPLMFYN